MRVPSYSQSNGGRRITQVEIQSIQRVFSLLKSCTGGGRSDAAPTQPYPGSRAAIPPQVTDGGGDGANDAARRPMPGAPVHGMQERG